MLSLLFYFSHIIIGSCLANLYVMAFTSGLPSASSDSTYRIQLVNEQSSGSTSSSSVLSIPFYDRPGDEYLSNKGDLWQYPLSELGCRTLSWFTSVAIIASSDATDGWNIGSVVTLVGDSAGRIQVLTRDFGANFWIDTDNGYDRPFPLSLSLSEVGSGMVYSIYTIPTMLSLVLMIDPRPLSVCGE